MNSRTRKILCTLGPASLNPLVIKRLEELGADLFRINLSHTADDAIAPAVKMIRDHARVPICFDTQGAQIRTGAIRGGSCVLEEYSEIELVGEEMRGTPQKAALYPAGAVNQLRPGDLVSVDFNSVILQVIMAEAGHCRARVLMGGKIGSNKGVAVDREISLEPFTPFDRRAIRLGVELGIHDYALSFAGCRADVEALRSMAPPGSKIIAKVENRRALEDLDAILKAADAILIDRGDLSREVPVEFIPRIQKWVIARANRAGTPVYVATNLLESMVNEPLPTRAEVNDVVNTLLDGADGLVLAAETAIGRYPVACVAFIRSLIDQNAMTGKPVSQAPLWGDKETPARREIRKHPYELAPEQFAEIAAQKKWRKVAAYVTAKPADRQAERIVVRAFEELNCDSLLVGVKADTETDAVIRSFERLLRDHCPPARTLLMVMGAAPKEPGTEDMIEVGRELKRYGCTHWLVEQTTPWKDDAGKLGMEIIPVRGNTI